MEKVIKHLKNHRLTMCKKLKILKKLQYLTKIFNFFTKKYFHFRKKSSKFRYFHSKIARFLTKKNSFLAKNCLTKNFIHFFAFLKFIFSNKG
jgi:hypothetical protein